MKKRKLSKPVTLGFMTQGLTLASFSENVITRFAASPPTHRDIQEIKEFLLSSM